MAENHLGIYKLLGPGKPFSHAIYLSAIISDMGSSQPMLLTMHIPWNTSLPPNMNGEETLNIVQSSHVISEAHLSS